MSEDIAEESEKADGFIRVKNGNGLEVEFEKAFGADLNESVSLYGGDVVYGIFHRQAIIQCQGRVRAVLNKEDSTLEDAIAAGENFTPGIKVARASGESLIKKMAKDVASGKISKEDLVAQLEAQLAKLAESEESN